MIEPNSFYSVLAPMFHISKIFGLAPFKLNTTCYQISKINLIWSILFMFSTFAYCTTFLAEKPLFGSSLLTKIPEVITSYLSPVSTSLHIMLGCIFATKILKILQEIDSFDKEMHTFLLLNLKDVYRKSKTCIILGLFVTVSYTTLSFSLTAVISKNSTAESFFQSLFLYVVPLIVNTFVDFQCCALILCVKVRFQWLNRKVASENLQRQWREDPSRVLKSTENWGKSEKHIEKLNKVSSILEKIRLKHHVLCMISKEINTAYSGQILLIVLKDFVTIITGLFYCGRYLLYQSFIPLEYLFYNIIQLSLAIVQLVALAVVCSSTAAEAQKMGSLIHNVVILPDEFKGKLKLQISFFSLQLLHQNVKFTACRTFVVNENLLLTIIGAVSTYLVIVIQFQLQDYESVK